MELRSEIADRRPANGGKEAIAPDAAWHATPVVDVFDRLDSNHAGLASAEAERRLAWYGPNRLAEAKKSGPLLRLLRQFHNVLIYVLLAAAAMTAVLGHWIDSGVIFGVVIINAVVGFVQEGKAAKALDAIRAMLSPSATVIRDGQRLTVSAADLVPGDVVALKSGDRIPADMRLIASHSLQVQESALTGESAPVTKSPDPVPAETDLGDRASMLYSGTFVTSGRGKAAVVATGQQTEIGRIGTMLTQVTMLRTPLLQQMSRFDQWLTLAILALAALTFVFGMKVQGYQATEMFLASVGLAVAAIPEGLPAILTITLAIGVARMARRQAIIRLLPAVETLGSVSVICSDKTGTLTRNEMTVTAAVTANDVYEVTGIGYRPLGEIREGGLGIDMVHHPDLGMAIWAAMMCNDTDLVEGDDTWQVQGDPMEGALLVLGLKGRRDLVADRKSYPRIDVIPFESAHKFMATLHHDREGRGHVCVKGAPERLVEMCAFQRSNGRDVPIDPAYWHERADGLARRGARILAVAYRPISDDHERLAFEDINRDLTLLGLFALLDPPREEAIAAVARCQAAGIRVKMITGDHAATAGAIGRQLGLGNEHGAITGRELDRLDPRQFAEAARDVDIFARTTPEHKLRLVEALQAQQQIVAMTGDGVNDAPALKRADVGVAMGRKGTEAAKEAAEMVLADDNFASIVHAVEEGRTVYDNLKKAILFILPTSGGEALTIVAAILLGVAMPITPVQILWVNMITAVTLALALAFEPAEDDVMRRLPRRRGEAILSRFLIWRIAFVSALLVLGTFGLFLLHLEMSGSLEIARTAAVNALVAGEIVYLLNSRRIHKTALSWQGLFGSRAVLAAIATVIGFQILFTYLPIMQQLFGSRGLDAEAWALILGFAIALFLLVETEKLLTRLFRRNKPRHPEHP